METGNETENGEGDARQHRDQLDWSVVGQTDQPLPPLVRKGTRAVVVVGCCSIVLPI